MRRGRYARFLPRPHGPPGGWALAFVILGVLATVNAIELTRDPDFFWHLGVGRDVLALRSLLPRDSYSYSVAGQPWAYKDLLADVVLYAGLTRFGWTWIAALKIAAAGVVASACRVAVRPGDRQPIVTLFCAGLILDSFWLVERPGLFSMALFATTLALIERARREAVSGTLSAARAILPIVAVNVAWTWLHRFAPLGHGLLLGLAVHLAIAKRASTPLSRALLGPPPRPGWIPVAFGAAIAGPIVAIANPNGIAVWHGVFMVAQNHEFRDRITEWKKLGPGELLAVFPVATLLVAVTLVVVALTLLRGARARDADPAVTLWHLAVVGALAAAMMQSVRWMPFAAIGSGVILGLVSSDLLARAPRRLRSIAGSPWTLLVAGGVLFVLLRVRRGDSPLAVGEDPAWTPRGAVTFAAEHGLRGPVVNSMELGGYLIWSSWPSVRVWIDGRAEQLYDTDFYLRCLRAEHDAPLFASMHADDPATWALAVNRLGEEHFAFLAHDPGWALVYWSDTAAVYVRRDAHPELDSLVFRHVDPADIPGSVSAALTRSGGAQAELAAIDGETRRMLEASPDSLRASLARTIFLARTGPPGREELRVAIEHLEKLARGVPEIEAFVESLKRR